MISYLNHILEYAKLTDDEIIERCGAFGIDVEAALTMMIERDLCKSALENIITELKKGTYGE